MLTRRKKLLSKRLPRTNAVKLKRLYGPSGTPVSTKKRAGWDHRTKPRTKTGQFTKRGSTIQETDQLTTRGRGRLRNRDRDPTQVTKRERGPPATQEPVQLSKRRRCLPKVQEPGPLANPEATQLTKRKRGRKPKVQEPGPLANPEPAQLTKRKRGRRPKVQEPGPLANPESAQLTQRRRSRRPKVQEPGQLINPEPVQLAKRGPGRPKKLASVPGPVTNVPESQIETIIPSVIADPTPGTIGLVAQDNQSFGSGDVVPGSSSSTETDKPCCSNFGTLPDETIYMANEVMLIDTGNYCFICYRRCVNPLEPVDPQNATRRKEVASRFLQGLSRYLNLNVYESSIGRQEGQFLVNFFNKTFKKGDEHFEIVACNACLIHMELFCDNYHKMEHHALMCENKFQTLCAIMRLGGRVPHRTSEFRKNVESKMKPEQKVVMNGIRRAVIRKSKRRIPPFVRLQRCDDFAAPKPRKTVLVQKGVSGPKDNRASGPVEVLEIGNELNLSLRTPAKDDSVTEKLSSVMSHTEAVSAMSAFKTPTKSGPSSTPTKRKESPSKPNTPGKRQKPTPKQYNCTVIPKTRPSVQPVLKPEDSQESVRKSEDVLCVTLSDSDDSDVEEVAGPSSKRTLPTAETTNPVDKVDAREHEEPAHQKHKIIYQEKEQNRGSCEVRDISPPISSSSPEDTDSSTTDADSEDDDDDYGSPPITITDVTGNVNQDFSQSSSAWSNESDQPGVQANFDQSCSSQQQTEEESMMDCSGIPTQNNASEVQFQNNQEERSDNSPDNPVCRGQFTTNNNYEDDSQPQPLNFVDPPPRPPSPPVCMPLVPYSPPPPEPDVPPLFEAHFSESSNYPSFRLRLLDQHLVLTRDIDTSEENHSILQLAAQVYGPWENIRCLLKQQQPGGSNPQPQPPNFPEDNPNPDNHMPPNNNYNPQFNGEQQGNGNINSDAGYDAPENHMPANDPYNAPFYGDQMGGNVNLEGTPYQEFLIPPSDDVEIIVDLEEEEEEEKPQQDFVLPTNPVYENQSTFNDCNYEDPAQYEVHSTILVGTANVAEGASSSSNSSQGVQFKEDIALQHEL